MPSIRVSAVLIALHNSLRSGLGDLRCRGVGDRFQGAVQSGVRHQVSLVRLPTRPAVVAAAVTTAQVTVGIGLI